jgi:hopanoid biosynthesis associated protein HpnK
MNAGAAGLIVTADDFGLHRSVNEAVERAHTEGILTAASLMVGASAAGDAIARARALPGLRVGLHLVLADGPSVLPPRAIPDLVDGGGRFGDRMVRDGVRFFCLPRVRRQLALEIRAQFEAFAASGLQLDHVDAHKHFHLHPTILSLMLRIGRDFGLRAVRLPRETGPPASPWLQPWLALLAARLDAAGIAHNDTVIGIRQSGRFDEPALLAALHGLPASGIVEIYLHPALASGAAISPAMRGYRHRDEFAALVAPRVRAACDVLRARGWRFGGYADLVMTPPAAAAADVRDGARP